jgi:predicted DsbA family dithiol-disulfide isomerase
VAKRVGEGVRVEIWSDVVCPWCYVGKRRFEAAVERFDGEVDVVYRAFELDPAVPTGGVPLGDYLSRKFGGAGAVTKMQGYLAKLGSEVGIEFRWDGIVRVNTFAAQRLLAWALADNPATQSRLKERLLKAYFSDNLDVGDHQVLASLAGEVGLDVATAAEVLATGQFGDQVRDDERRAGEVDIHSVPTYMVDQRFAIPGAQDPDTFLRLLQQAA